jgi:hypothetical protein
MTADSVCDALRPNDSAHSKGLSASVAVERSHYVDNGISAALNMGRTLLERGELADSARLIAVAACLVAWWSSDKRPAS